MIEEKYGFVYIWFDKKHKRYYVGAHWGLECDGYVCSSKWMNISYRRRPLDFTRRILSKVYTNRQDLFKKEQEWLNLIKKEELGKRYYNLCRNADHHWVDGPNHDTVVEKISKSVKALHQDPQYRERFLESMSNRDYSYMKENSYIEKKLIQIII